MADNSSPSRFKADMPQIPGVPRPRRSSRFNPLTSLIIGVVALAAVLVLVLLWFSHSRPAESARVVPTPQIEVPPPPPDPSASLPHADEAHPVIASVADLSKPWSSADFFIHNLVSGENVPATIVRLPSGSPLSASGYWAFSRKAVYGNCQLEYIGNLDKLRQDYDYQHAAHPLVGNPCTRTLYDPLKTVNLPGNVWIRGAIVQGSDVRPPLGVEIQIQGKQILALRTE
jgi:hypothetical protein